MPDIIQLLPDNIANQIAAGEVIQRPASAVKELLENAVDAGATHIQLIIQDAGKALVQVIDNGKGMSETDARMCFERHATSKISHIDDLFRIRTMGFRGEALASIAAVAQVELKTRRPDEELGTFITVENSLVTRQEPCACNAGSNICMKNLFFNVPARRNFLKSNPAELRHIVDEFIRVAMAFPALFFSLTSNGQEVFHLEAGNHKQRITQIMGSTYNAKLVQIKEDTDYMNIYGFVGKPETARKTRGDQYFFVNNRFIKSAYLNHAVNAAFSEMISKDSFPSYALYIDLDPAQVDINVHPTKQEIKFEDEKIIYAFVHSAIKHALAQYSIAPSLDFTLNPEIQSLDAVTKPITEEDRQIAGSTQLFKSFTQKHQAHFIDPGRNNSGLKEWKDFYAPTPGAAAGNLPDDGLGTALEQFKTVPATEGLFEYEKKSSGFGFKQPGKLQVLFEEPMAGIRNTYIFAQTNNGFILVHQQLAHERILYNRFAGAMHGRKMAAQQQLFPATLHLAPADAVLLNDLLPELQQLGFLIEPFGSNSFIIQATPADVLHGNDTNSIELLLEQFKHFSSDVKFGKREKVIRCMARQQAIKAGQSLTQKEMQTLVQELFETTEYNVTPSGSPTFMEFREDAIDKMFGR